MVRRHVIVRVDTEADQHDEREVRETFENIDEVAREDGWVLLLRGREGILRIQEKHVKTMEWLAT